MKLQLSGINTVVSVCLRSDPVQKATVRKPSFDSTSKVPHCTGPVSLAVALLMMSVLSCRAESLFAAYYFFQRKGYEVTLASVKGGKLPIDPKSVVTPYLTTVVKKGLTDGMTPRTYNISRIM